MPPTLIKNVAITTPDEVIPGGAVLIADGIIEAVGQSHSIDRLQATHTIDGSGLLLAPGFIDLQLNGAFGMDFTAEPESIWQVAAQLPQYGVTTFLPTIITAPLESIQQAQTVLAAGPPAEFSGALPLGLHLEGPFLNPAKKGAHNPIYLREPALEATSEWSPESGVRLVTLAPELPSALALIEQLAANDVVVSAGHTLADFQQAQTAINHGVRYGTHLFNAMTGLHHRRPGIVPALLNDPRVTIGIIPDGIHVHPSLVHLAWQMGNVRLNLVTDAMAALGMPPGSYQLGDYAVTVTAEKAQLADGTLAGSILSLDQAVRNLMQFTGCSLTDALQTVTTTPASLLRIDQHKGHIKPGYDADLVLLTHEFEVKATMVDGQFIFTDGTFPHTEVEQ